MSYDPPMNVRIMPDWLVANGFTERRDGTWQGEITSEMAAWLIDRHSPSLPPHNTNVSPDATWPKSVRLIVSPGGRVLDGLGVLSIIAAPSRYVAPLEGDAAAANVVALADRAAVPAIVRVEG